MIVDSLVVLMTVNLSDQVQFYKNILGLELIFDNQDTIGLGKNNKIFLVLREDQSEDSHHLSQHKGPQILTFKCQGNVDEYISKIKESGFKIRDTLKLPNYNAYYLFIEDFDGNEICLDFPLNEVIVHKPTTSKNNLKEIISNKPNTMSVLVRELDNNKSYLDFREAWLPPVPDTSKYFDLPVIVFNGQNVQNPSEIVSVALVWADVEKAISAYQKTQIMEDIREEKISKITQQNIETRFCNIVDIDILGS